MDSIHYSDTRELPLEGLLALYRANAWSAAEKPDLLHKALRASHSLITAWDDARVVGLGNSLSDGFLVVYYSHLLVLPEYQGRGIGTELMRRLMARYQGFHQHILIADGRRWISTASADSNAPAGQSRCGSMRVMTIDQKIRS